jgi:hypothetical protein
VAVPTQVCGEKTPEGEFLREAGIDKNLRPAKGADFPQLREKQSSIRYWQFLFEPNTD